nr:helix-turn-helix transcriptional regulator [Nakamurella flavida]
MFAAAVCRALRESRRRQKLTQADVAQRTGGLVSKAALANYETGHRSLRIDVLWVIARALGEDLGGLLNMAERGIGRWQSTAGTGSVTVDIDEVMEAEDPRLAPVRRWFELRSGGGSASAMTLDDGAILALAALMNVSPAECREILVGTAAEAGGAPVPLPEQDSGPVAGRHGDDVAERTGFRGEPAAI